VALVVRLGGVALARHAAGAGEIETGKERDGEADWWTSLGVGFACQQGKESGREKAGGHGVFKKSYPILIGSKS
jgi:hypothetical protein